MTILVDTSALYALLDASDHNHTSAAAAWDRLLDDAALVTHTYVVVESSALVQHRLGMDAVEQLHAALLPVVDVRSVGASLHQRAVARWRAAARRNLSLVDVTSFVLMEELALSEAFACDADFAAAGFAVTPAPHD